MYWREGAICLIFLVLSTFLGDQILGLMGYPSAREAQVAHPKNFYERRKNIEYEVDFRTNSQGLRYKDIPLEKPSGEQRVLVLGDSFTEGVGVEENETFSAHLEHYFSGRGQGAVRFINGGLAGKGPLQYWKIFYGVGRRYNPDVILVCLFANDVSDMEDHLNVEDLYISYTHEYESKEPGIKKLLHGLLPRTYTMLSQLKDQLLDLELLTEILEEQQEDFVQQVIQKAEEQDIPDDDVIKWKNSLDYKLVKAANLGEINGAILSGSLVQPNYWRNAIEIDTAESELKFQAMSFVLDELRSVAEADGAQVWLIFIPTSLQYVPSAYEHDHPHLRAGMVRNSRLKEQSEIQKRLEQWTRKRDIPFLDLTASLREKANNGMSLTYRLDGHWNSTGHIVAATTIRDWIVKQNLFDSPIR